MIYANLYFLWGNFISLDSYFDVGFDGGRATDNDANSNQLSACGIQLNRTNRDRKSTTIRLILAYQ